MTDITYIHDVLDGRRKIEKHFPAAQSLFKIGLTETPLTMELPKWAKVSGEEFDTENAYIKPVERRKNRKSFFSSNGDKEFIDRIYEIANDNFHAVEKVAGEIGYYYKITNGDEHFVDVDLLGNCAIRTSNYKDPALEDYIKAVAEKLKHSDLYIVYNVANLGLPAEDNERFLRIITKTLLDSGIEHGRLQIADTGSRHILEEMSPNNRLPIQHMMLVEGQYIPTSVSFNKYSDDDVGRVVAKGLRFVEYAGGKLHQLESFSDAMESNHNLKISFAERGSIIRFESADGRISEAFKTESMKGGKSLRDSVAEYEELFGAGSLKENSVFRKVRGLKND